MKTELLKSLNSSFSESCKAVSDAMKDGTVEASRASHSAKQDTVKTTVAMSADSSHLTPEAVKTLKSHIRRYNAGHAFQTVFGVKLAQFADIAAEVEKLIPAPAVKAPAGK